MDATEPTNGELVVFAESLLQNVAEHLRERDVLEDAVERHRATWLILYAASNELNGIVSQTPPE